MILTIDIGNSNIMLGGFRKNEADFIARIATDVKKTADEYAVTLLGILSLYETEPSEISGAIISSVVPHLTKEVKCAVSRLFDIEPLTVGPGIKTGISIRCDNPSSVGADIICTAVGAHNFYGSPSLVIDMGTATKMSVIDSKGAFIGVSIIPGVMMSLNALSDGTAQLPKVSLDAPPSVIGKNTESSMKSGIVFGNAAMIDGMIDRINEEMGETLPVIATGGLSHVIIPHCKHEIKLDEQLVLKGLYTLYLKNN